MKAGCKRAILAGFGLLVLWLVLRGLDSSGLRSGTPRLAGQVAPQLSGCFDIAVLLAPDGSLWEWGNLRSSTHAGSNAKRELVPVPRRLGSSRDWVAVSRSSSHGLALKSDGSLWGWCPNGNRPLGPSVPPTTREPVLLSEERDWIRVHAGNGWSLAIKQDRSLWAWGLNRFGMVGDATTQPRDTPFRVGGVARWREISTTFQGTFGIQEDGSLWAWGNPWQRGEPWLTPRRIEEATRCTHLAGGNCQVGLRADGGIQALFDNGTLRLGSEVLTGPWTQAEMGISSCLLIRDAKGQWWGSGDQPFGQLGIGHGRVARKPELISGADEDAWAIRNLGDTTLFLMRDGTLWQCGKRLGVPPRNPWVVRAARWFNQLPPWLRGSKPLYDKEFSADSIPRKVWSLPD
jgi:alpha-tubulin suppressor-like RCC1 family protein